MGAAFIFPSGSEARNELEDCTDSSSPLEKHAPTADDRDHQIEAGRSVRPLGVTLPSTGCGRWLAGCLLGLREPSSVLSHVCRPRGFASLILEPSSVPPHVRRSLRLVGLIPLGHGGAGRLPLFPLRLVGHAKGTLVRPNNPSRSRKDDGSALTLAFTT